MPTSDVTPNGLAKASCISIEEQDAVVSVLEDMSEEIDALEQRLVKALGLKTGMMQELLTGKTRLIKTDKKQEAA